MRRQILWLVAVAAIGAAALVAAGGASATGMTQVDGIQSLVDAGNPFDATDDVYSMDGYGGGRPALIGSWYTRSFVLGVVTPSGVVTSTGTEEFVGCLDANGNRSCDGGEPSGTIGFAYEFSGKYDFATGAEDHGRCHHAITGGTDGFTGVTGDVRFKDDPDTGCAFYSGHLNVG